MNIITGYRAEPHYTNQQMRDENISVYGDGVYILNIGSQMAATIVSANEISIADGLVVAQGCTAEVARGTSESITVENGEQGMLRKDLIVLRYTKDASTNIEDMQLHIIKGTSASTDPVRPSHTSGSIADGDTLVEFPLYEVNLSGITIQSVVLLATKKSIADKKSVDDLSAKVGTGTLSTTAKNLIGAVNELLGKIGTGTLSTTTKNLVGAVNELLTKLGTGTFSTTAKNAVGAINELLGKINTANSNITAVTNRVSSLETKTEGLVSIRHWNINAGATQFLQLHAVSMYIFVVNSASIDNGMRGLYLVGVAGSNALGIKAVSTAGSVTVSDAGSGLIKFVNNGGATMRLTMICTYGTSV